jgi:hypothetical protein
MASAMTTAEFGGLTLTSNQGEPSGRRQPYSAKRRCKTSNFSGAEIFGSPAEHEPALGDWFIDREVQFVWFITDDGGICPILDADAPWIRAA